MLSASELKSLKTKFDTEWKRRSYNGSMTSYAGKSFFPSDPTVDEKFYADQFNTILNPIVEKMATNLTGNLKKAIVGEAPPSDLNNTFLTKLYNTLSSAGAESSTNNCNAACSGLCVSECSTGCKSSCKGGCSSCEWGCDDGCGYGCNFGCTSCSGCSGCGSTCMWDCSGSCALQGWA